MTPRRASLSLLERGVRLTGIDGCWDAPFPYAAERHAQARSVSIIWESDEEAGPRRPPPHREPAQPRGASPDGLHGVAPSDEDRARFRGLDAGGRGEPGPC